MENNKVIIYTLIILLIAAVIFNPVITGNALKLPWATKPVTTLTVPTSTDTGVDGVSKSVTGGCIQLTAYQCNKVCAYSGWESLPTNDNCYCKGESFSQQYCLVSSSNQCPSKTPVIGYSPAECDSLCLKLLDGTTPGAGDYMWCYHKCLGIQI